MSFEMMLASLMNLPVKFLIGESINLSDQHKKDSSTDDQIKADKISAIKELDQQLKQIKIPSILLDRLKKEFDDSHSLSTQFGKSLEQAD